MLLVDRRRCLVHIIFFMETMLLFSNVTSRTGSIELDINDDQSHELRLDSTGLYIGNGGVPSANLHVQGDGILSERLSIGSVERSSTLNVTGSFGLSQQEVSSSSVELSHSMVMVDTSSDNLAVQLPDASSGLNRRYWVKKKSSLNHLTVYSPTLIEGESGLLLSSGNFNSLQLASSSGNWFVISKYPDSLEESTPRLFEQFDGLQVGSISSQGSGGGWGSGLWSVTGDALYDDTQSLIYASLPGYSRGGVLDVGAVDVGSGWDGPNRVLDVPLTELGTYYIGCLVKVSGTPNNAVFNIKSSNDQIAYAGVWGGNPNWALSEKDGGVFSTDYSTTAYTTSTTYLVVKLTLSAVPTDDTAELYINPTSAADLAGLADASRTYSSDFVDIKQISFLRNNNGGNIGSIEVDEFRLDDEPEKMFSRL